MNPTPELSPGPSASGPTNAPIREAENSTTARSRPRSAGRGPGLAPWLAAAGTCALVTTSYHLGADWLANMTLGLPVGAWIAVLAGAWTKLASAPSSRSWLIQEPSGDAVALADGHTSWPASPIAGAALTAAGAAANAGARILDELSTEVGERAPSERFARAHDSMRWPTRPLRVGIAVPDDAVRTALEAPGTAPVEFVPIEDSSPDPTLCEKRTLDAVVHPRDGGLALRTARRYGREAAWFDWAGPRPMTYSTVFPLRIDPEWVTLGEIGGEESGRIVRAIIESASALSRTPQRLNLLDRLRGRRPIVLTSSPSDATLDEDAIDADRCMRYLAQMVARGAGLDPAQPAVRAAARAVSAWLATRPGQLSDSERLAMLEAAARLAGRDPEVMLRLAAARLAVKGPRIGLESLLEAQRTLRDTEHFAEADHLAFVQSELEHGARDAMTLGRASAGLCLVSASTPVERLAYLREDLLEDMKFSAWAGGAEHERAVLAEVFEALERDRERETVVYSVAA